MYKSGLEIDKVLEAAVALGFENIIGGANENEIWVSHFWMPPKEHLISRRQIDKTVLINQSDNTKLRIEYYGWDNTKPPLVWELSSQDKKYGHSDDLLIQMFENFQDDYVDTLEILLGESPLPND